MNERLKEIRKAVKLKQIEFAKKIGVTQAYLSMLESGKVRLSAKNIKLICISFGVSESWLKTGFGPMFTETSESLDDEAFITTYMTLLPENRAFLRTTVQSLLDTQISILSKQAVR
jgi:transcriptional regulator with XRE-family HTH domain